MTKQNDVVERGLELIDGLPVGDAIPRSGTFVGRPKIAQELTITSFSEDMRRRGMAPSSRTIELRVTTAGARLGQVLHVSPGEPIVVATRLRLADGDTMAIETLHIPSALEIGRAH